MIKALRKELQVISDCASMLKLLIELSAYLELSVPGYYYPLLLLRQRFQPRSVEEFD